jgi:hypothetical protein
MERAIVNRVEKALHYKARIKIVIRRTAINLCPLIGNRNFEKTLDLVVAS